MKKGRNVVDMVVARLPAPDKLMKSKSGARVASYDEGEDMGLEDAVNSLGKAFGVKLDDEQRQMAMEAIRDAVHICMHAGDDEEDEEEDDEG